MKLQSLVSWHKVLGMVATFFIVLLSVTGIMLLHTDDLKLADKTVENNSLLVLYDIAPDKAPVSYLAAGHYITQIDDQIYMNNRRLSENQDRLMGAVFVNDLYVLGYINSVSLFTGDGELVEKLARAHGLPQQLNTLGAYQDRVVLDTQNGIFISDIDVATWTGFDRQDISWSQQTSLPATIENELLQLYRGDGLPLERVVQDLHSGRILGTAGVILIDISVVIFLVLSITGWWTWYKRRELQKEIDEEETY